MYILLHARSMHLRRIDSYAYWPHIWVCTNNNTRLYSFLTIHHGVWAFMSHEKYMSVWYSCVWLLTYLIILTLTAIFFWIWFSFMKKKRFISQRRADRSNYFFRLFSPPEENTNRKEARETLPHIPSSTPASMATFPGKKQNWLSLLSPKNTRQRPVGLLLESREWRRPDLMMGE